MTDSTLQANTETHPADSAESAATRARVHDFLRGLAKAWRTYLLYEGRSAALDKILEGVRETLEQVFSEVPFFTLEVDERELMLAGVSVYHGEESSDRARNDGFRENLAFVLYRDGLRELTFLRGFEREETDALLEILARVSRLRGEDQDDLLTLLWDHDWYYLRYRYVEGLPEGTVLPAPTGEPPARVDFSLVQEEQPEPERAGTVSPEDFRGALYFLDADELRRLEVELQREMQRDTWSDVLNALFDRIQDSGALRQEQIIGILADVLPTLLGSGKLDTAALVLAELVRIATGGQRLPVPVMRELRGLFEQLADPSTVTELVRTLEETGATVNEASLGSLLSFFPPEALGPLLKAAETSATPAVRRTIQASTERLAGSAREHVTKLLASPDGAVAAGAARLVGRVRITAAAPELARLLRRPEAATRLAAVEALQELRSSSSSEALEGALEDADREVRVAAARALAALRYAPAKARLEAALEGKRLREADRTEKIAFFEAYGGLAGGDGVPVLEKILNGRSWLGRREGADIRACAALGLGKIRHPAAEKALNAAASDPDPVVRSAVGRALKAIKQ